MFVRMSEPEPAESQKPVMSPDAPWRPATEVRLVSPKLVTSTNSRDASNVHEFFAPMFSRLRVPVDANVPDADVSSQILALIPWRAVAITHSCSGVRV